MSILSEMKIESVIEEKSRIIVVTTGARYVFDKTCKEATILCFQKQNQDRHVATIYFRSVLANVFGIDKEEDGTILQSRQQPDFPFTDLCVVRKDENTVVLHQKAVGCGYLRIQINRDSMVDISCSDELIVNVIGDFIPDYTAEKSGNVMLIDHIGGIGAYPYRGLRNNEWKNINKKEWSIDYTFNGGFQFYFCVFPPRKYDMEKSFNDRIAHHGPIGNWDPVPAPYPTDEEIEEMSKYANILTLHDTIWQGKFSKTGKIPYSLAEMYSDFAWSCYDYVPANENDLRRVIKRAHSFGMKVIPYMSPKFSMARGKEFVDRVERALDEYGFDGVYFDGVLDDIPYAYQMIRDIRAMLKDRILYFHCSSEPLDSRVVYCPFLDTYADYILKAEGTAVLKDGSVHINEDSLRYNVSGYNISNSIGHFCYYDLQLSVIESNIDNFLNANVRLYLGSPESSREKLLKKIYFPKLIQMSEDFISGQNG